MLNMPQIIKYKNQIIKIKNITILFVLKFFNKQLMHNEFCNITLIIISKCFKYFKYFNKSQDQIKYKCKILTA